MDSDDELLSGGVGDDAELNTSDDIEKVDNSGYEDGTEKGPYVFEMDPVTFEN
ncbi:MAG: hypothetical protein P9L91_06555 [Candidatus Zophobacter franzmannii]|nr:hypothetical protein [Candidatus Zophobacter franzmannii]